MKIDTAKFAAARTLPELEEIIWKSVKYAVDCAKITRNRVLVAGYIAPERTAGGIIRPHKTIDEDRFQGKVGLVLKVGPQAFEFGPEEKDVVRAGVGEWVFFRSSDGWELALGDGCPCRVIYDDNIIGVTSDPSTIW